MPDAAARAAHVLVALALVLPAVLFLPSAADPVNIVKMTALLLCAIALLAVGAVRVIVRRRARLPWALPAVAAGALLVALVVAAVASPATTSAVVGAYGRNSGLLAYASAIVVFLAVLAAFDRAGTRIVLYALMASGGFTASYGLLQYLGVDAINWDNPNPIISALGNSNFASAYVAICLPAFLWGALRTTWSVPARVACAVAAAACLLVAFLSEAVQGPLAAAAGGAVLAGAWLLDRPAHVRRGGFAALATVGAAGTLFLAWGATGGGPAATVFDDTGSRARGWFWQAALSMWADHPILGVGLERFGSFWLRARSLDAVRGLGAEDVTDAAHSVPLHLLATGGLLLFVVYAVFVAVTAWALVAGLRRLRGDERLLVGALGGCWAGYQLQSLVSIDQVPLLVTHYALAAAIIVAAGRATTRLVRLPGHVVPPAPGPGGSRRQKARTPNRRRLTPADVAVLAVAGVTALALVWFALVPLRANIAARSGDLALARGDGTPALAAYGAAADLLPGEPLYWDRLGRLLLRAEQPQQALDAFRRGIDAAPDDVIVVRGAARAAEAAGDTDAAARYHRRALELHPNSPSTIIAAADFEFQQGRPDGAEQLLQKAVQVLPSEAKVWAALGELKAATGDADAAREALQRALELDPQVAGAAERLQSLQQGST